MQVVADRRHVMITVGVAEGDTKHPPQDRAVCATANQRVGAVVVRRVLDGTSIAHLAGILPDGAPHSVPVWVVAVIESERQTVGGA
jgi:hypothetical protein